MTIFNPFPCVGEERTYTIVSLELSTHLSLTELFLDNAKLDNTLLQLLTETPTLRILSITRSLLPWIGSEPCEFENWGLLPSISDLFISPPIAADALFIHALEDSLVNLHLNSSNCRLGVFQPFFCTLGLHVMTMPRLRRLTLERFSICQAEFRMFLRRHSFLSLNEVNISAFSGSYSLSWVVRAMMELTGQMWLGVDDNPWFEEPKEGNYWEKYEVEAFGCLIKGRAFSQLGLTFALNEEDDVPLDDPSLLVPLFKMPCFLPLEVLRLSADPEFIGTISDIVVSTFLLLII